MRVGQIGEHELVLEIGSGDRPNPRSDVLVDRYIEDNTERGGDLRIDRPLIVADAQELPFKDGAFDYIVCFHILEHMPDPAQFLREIAAPFGQLEGDGGVRRLTSPLGRRLSRWRKLLRRRGVRRAA